MPSVQDFRVALKVQLYRAQKRGLQHIDIKASELHRRVGGTLYIFLVLALAVPWTVPEARAQVLYGSVVGLVTDPTGAAIPRAHVTLNSPQTNLKREIDADEAVCSWWE